MSDQNNYYPQQPQYVDPQATQSVPPQGYAVPPQGYAVPPQGYAVPPQGYAVPPQGYAVPPQQYYPPQGYAVPPQQYYAPAPAPVYTAPAPAVDEPEVIIQEAGFADYGFGEGDSISTGHDFGNFMDDDNTEPDTLDVFNTQTPNFDIAEVEAASKAATAEEKAMFTSTTANYDLNAVEEAAHTTTDMDREVFSNSFAVGAVEQTVSDTPAFDAAMASFNKTEEPISEINPAPPVFEAPAVPVEPTPAPAAPAAAPSAFMASMQSMFTSMNAAPAPEQSTPRQEPVEEAAPTLPVEPVVPVAPAEPIPVAPVAPVEPEPAPVAPTPADVVVNATPAAAPIQDISSQSAEPEKGPEYWDNIDKMLENFEDKPKATQTEVEAPTYKPTYSAPVMPAAPVVAAPAAPAPVAAPAQPTSPVQETKRPFSEGAPVTNQAPVAPQNQVPVAPSYNYVAPAPVAPTPAPVAPTPAPVAPTPAPVPEEPKQKEDMSWLQPQENPENEKRAAREAARAERDAARAAKAEAREAEKKAKAEAKAAAKAEKKAKKETVDVKETEAVEEKKQGPDGFKGFIYRVFPNGDDSVLEKVRKLIAVISAIALFVCAIYFFSSFLGSRSNKKDANKLADMMSSSENSAAAWEDIYARYPNVTFPSGMQAKFADIYAMNTDLVGWIRIPGLGIDYPVVQTTDDAYYLKHDFNKQSSVYGTIFLDADNKYKDLDLNTVIYGHAMRRDKQMFSRLHDYKDSSAFIENPIIEFNTLYADYKFKVYCAFITNGSSVQDNGYLLDYTFNNLSSTESFAGFVAEINQRKLYTTGVDILPTDKIITLSTCSYEFDNARLVVIGRLLRDGESEEVDESKVKDSENPRYPQAWYDVNKKTNPYASYSHWRAQ